MVKNKKAISPVVTTALLLVVAVFSVVGFQAWFQTFQSAQQADVEKKAQAGAAIGIERLEDDSVYILNSAVDTYDNVEIKVQDSSGYVSCTNSTSLSLPQGLTQVDLNGTSCGLVKNRDYTVVVIVDDGLFSETEIARTGS
jgi:flagellin-like protein